MKYNIIINQLYLSQTKLTLTDAAILDYIMSFYLSENTDQIEINEGGKQYRYVWINYKHLIENMPLLEIKTKSGITYHIQKIEKEGFIKTRIIQSEQDNNRRLYIRLTDKIKNVFFYDGGMPINFLNTPPSKKQGKKRQNKVLKNLNGGCSNILTNNTIIDNNILLDNNLSSDNILYTEIDTLTNNINNNILSSNDEKPSKGKVSSSDCFDINYYKAVESKFLEFLEKNTKIKDYAFNYAKERKIIKKWTKDVLKKHPDWTTDDILPRLNSYFKRWFEINEDEIPTINKIFSAYSLNVYRLWVAKNYPDKIFDSL